jgi:hypothetical protein
MRSLKLRCFFAERSSYSYDSFFNRIRSAGHAPLNAVVISFQIIGAATACGLSGVMPHDQSFGKSISAISLLSRHQLFVRQARHLLKAADHSDRRAQVADL